MIQADHIKMKYKEGENAFFAVNDISLTFEPGTFTAIIGRSGSGKSTLLSILGGLQKPTEGVVQVEGSELYEYTDNQLADYRSRHIGFIFQAFYLEERYTVYQNIEIALMIGECPKKERKKRIGILLERVGLLDKEKVRVEKLSGGEKQRVCIARAIANAPSVILADEPCGNLDFYNGRLVMDLLRELSDEGKTVILVTHNLEDAGRTDRIIELKDGKVIRDEKNG